MRGPTGKSDRTRIFFSENRNRAIFLMSADRPKSVADRSRNWPVRLRLEESGLQFRKAGLFGDNSLKKIKPRPETQF
jgi:hypothetical protein